jgi:hypothetical protein
MPVAKSQMFEPTTVRAMADAVDEGWTILLQVDAAARSRPNETRLALAKRILELASAGSHDVRTLRDMAVASLAASRAAEAAP